MPKNRITIEVTAEDMRAGVKNQCLGCPISIAATRKVQELTGDPDLVAMVSSDYMDIGDRNKTVNALGFGWMFRDGGIARAQLPKLAQTFVDRFDNGLPEKPLTFTINI